MKAMDFVGLLNTFRIPRTPDKGYTIMVPLMEIIETLEKNNLVICTESERK